MNSAKVYNLEGKVVSELSLNPSIFGLNLSTDLIHQSVVTQMANARHSLAHTKTRGLVRGGGRKPWRQKGTGRARAGSNRSPIWKGGGVTFGPSKDQNFSKNINKKMKKKALLMSLSNKFSSDAIKFVDAFRFDSIKTKKAIDAFDKLNLSDKKILIVLPAKDDIVRFSVNNIPKVKVILADSLNIVDVLGYDQIIIPVDSIKVIEKTFLKK